MLSNESWGKKEEGGLEWWHLSSQVIVMRDGALLSWRWLSTRLPMGSSEWIPYFAFLVQMTFALPIKLSLSQPMSFLTFTVPILWPIPLWGNDWGAGCCLVWPTGFKPWHSCYSSPGFLAKIMYFKMIFQKAFCFLDIVLPFLKFQLLLLCSWVACMSSPLMSGSTDKLMNMSSWKFLYVFFCQVFRGPCFESWTQISWLRVFHSMLPSGWRSLSCAVAIFML